MNNDDLMRSVTFETAADYYDATRGMPEGTSAEAAELLVNAGTLTSDSVVLEIGAGTGRISHSLRPFVGRLYGIDLSRNMLSKFSDKLSAGDTNIQLLQGDITRLPFPENTFDALIAVHILHLVPRYQDALAEAARVLKPDGHLLHGTSGMGFGDLWQVWREALVDYPPQQARLKWDKIDQTLHDAGWQAHEESHSMSYRYHRAPSIIRDWLANRRFSITWELPDELLAKGVELMEAALKETYDDPDQPTDMEAAFTVYAYQPPQAV